MLSVLVCAVYLVQLYQSACRTSKMASETVNSKKQQVAIQFCLLDDNLRNDQAIIMCIRNLGGTYFSFCEDALNAVLRKRTDKRIIFVATEFSGKRFKKAKQVTSQILGPPALLSFAELLSRADGVMESSEVIPVLKRPLYNLVMKDVVAVVDGFSPIENARICKLIHHMGGFLMKNLTSSSIARFPLSRLHLVAFSALCRSYPLACQYGIRCLTNQYLDELWTRRQEPNLNLSNQITPYPCLRNIPVQLIGFQLAEQQQLTTAVESLGGTLDCSLLSPRIVVVDSESRNFHCTPVYHDNFVRTFRLDFNGKFLDLDLEDEQFLVGSEFLSACLRHKVLAPVRRYAVIRDAGSPLVRRGKRSLSSELPSPKRRPRAEMPRTETPSRQLRTLALSSPAGQQQQFPRAIHREARLSECDENEPASLFEACQRRQRATEVLHTERNYVRMLRSLLENVVGPLEADNSHGKSGLFSAIDLDIVFGRLPIIARIHEKIVSDLSAVMEPWSNDCQIGIIYSKYADEIAQVYLPYVNSYDDSRRFLQDSIKQKPRLQAFISRCLAVPEFGRQSLADILIRPVQRLPTILLLLKDLQKHTDDSMPDYSGLTLAVAAIDNVLNIVNAGRRASGVQLTGPFASSSLSLASSSHGAMASPTPSRKSTNKRSSVDGNSSLHPSPDSTSLKAWEKARKLAVRTSTRVSRVFAFGSKSSGSGLKRTASTVSVSVKPSAKNPKNLPESDVNIDF